MLARARGFVRGCVYVSIYPPVLIGVFFGFFALDVLYYIVSMVMVMYLLCIYIGGVRARARVWLPLVPCGDAVTTL